MSEQVTKESDLPLTRSPLPPLLVLFFGSGCAALIYEIVWFQMLQLVIGSSAVSLGVLLGTFMGGMCLGSLLVPRLISRPPHPIRVYALLEAGIGLFGLLMPAILPLAARVYSAHVAGGWAGILLRGLFAGVCLLPPTILMGATLPAMSRWIATTPRGISWLGFFYGGNIAGAVFGCLLAGFYLLRLHDSVTATLVAAAINGTVALAALLLSFVARHEFLGGTPGFLPESADEEGFQRIDPKDRARWKFFRPAHAAIALSGMTALGAEVVWTRLLSLTFGGTVYAFSIILAVFLFGLGIGSGIGSVMARRIAGTAAALGWCQFLLTAAIAWTAWALTQSLPFWPIDPSLTANAWLNFQLDLARCLWALLPATMLWGASFPLALATVAAPGRDPGRFVGSIYAANTVGGILGGIGFSVILIPLAGTQQSQRLLIVLSTAAALVMFVPCLSPWLNKFSAAAVSRVLAILAGLVLVPVWLASGVARVPGELVAHGRYTATELGKAQILYVGEGINSSVAVSQEWDSDVRNFHVSGKIEASTDPRDMRLQRMLGHIPALVNPRPRSVLVVGCGAGVTAGTFTTYPTVESITICELEPLVPKLAAKYFTNENYNVLSFPRTKVVFDDARHYVLTTHDKFDIITSDPIHPWVKGSATLYTKEYFEQVKNHLNPGGVVTQWVPLYESDAGTVRSEMATFFEVFPNGTLWSNDQNGNGYDVVLLGQAGETKINLDDIRQRLARPEYSKAAQSLANVGFKSATDLFATYAGRAHDLAPWLAGAPINRDRNLRLQYLAGLHANWYHSESIFKSMVAYRQFPDGLFAGSDESLQPLKKALTGAK